MFTVEYIKVTRCYLYFIVDLKVIVICFQLPHRGFVLLDWEKNPSDIISTSTHLFPLAVAVCMIHQFIIPDKNVVQCVLLISRFMFGNACLTHAQKATFHNMFTDVIPPQT